MSTSQDCSAGWSCLYTSSNFERHLWSSSWCCINDKIVLLYRIILYLKVSADKPQVITCPFDLVFDADSEDPGLKLHLLFTVYMYHMLIKGVAALVLAGGRTAVLPFVIYLQIVGATLRDIRELSAKGMATTEKVNHTHHEIVVLAVQPNADGPTPTDPVILQRIIAPLMMEDVEYSEGSPIGNGELIPHLHLQKHLPCTILSLCSRLAVRYN